MAAPAATWQARRHHLGRYKRHRSPYARSNGPGSCIHVKKRFASMHLIAATTTSTLRVIHHCTFEFEIANIQSDDKLLSNPAGISFLGYIPLLHFGIAGGRRLWLQVSGKFLRSLHFGWCVGCHCSMRELEFCELVRMPGMDQEFKKKFDTTKMSPEELKMCNLKDARRPRGEGPSPVGTLHQQGGVGLSKAERYPVVLAGVAVLTGIGTFMYYRSLNAQQIPGKANQALDAIHIPATAKAPADAPRC